MTANQPMNSYNSIRIRGPISVKKVPELSGGRFTIVLLLGPTGSGKSSFIEALAPKGSLEISSHRLEGCTQSISAYRVENLTRHVLGEQSICIVDVPGFGDTKISEIGIVSMIKKWMQRMNSGLIWTCSIHTVGRILYFTPINVVRIPGSQRRMLKTFQALTGLHTAGNTIIVSTMWDLLSGDSSTNRAERNFEQLQDVVWKDSIRNGSQITKFYNTLESVLLILDNACRHLNQGEFHIERLSQIHAATYGVDLYDNLQIRIQNLKIEQTNVRSELEVAKLGLDSQLITVLSSQLAETERILEKFNQELEDFGPHPDLLGEGSAALLALNYQPIGTVAQRPVEATPSPRPGSSEPEPTVPHHLTMAKRGTFARVISSLKCWGRGVHEHHDL